MFAQTTKDASTEVPPELQQLLEWAENEITAPPPPKVYETYQIKTELAKARLWQIVTLGQSSHMHKNISRIMNRLLTEHDPLEWEVSLSLSPLPNAWVEIDEEEKKGKVGVTMGLFTLCENESELASVLGHEMTHKNKKHFQAINDSPEVSKFLDGLEAFRGLQPRHREEIRADIGAIDRLIRAKYNPWGGYNLQKKFSKLIARLIKRRFTIEGVNGFSKDFYSTHPSSDLRMEIAKAYVVARGKDEDLSKLTASKQPFDSIMKLIRLESSVYSAPFTNSPVRLWFRYSNYYIWASIFGFRFAKILGSHFAWMDTAFQNYGFFQVFNFVKFFRSVTDGLGYLIAQPFVWFSWDEGILDLLTGPQTLSNSLIIGSGAAAAALLTKISQNELKSPGIPSFLQRSKWVAQKLDRIYTLRYAERVPELLTILKQQARMVAMWAFLRRQGIYAPGFQAPVMANYRRVFLSNLIRSLQYIEMHVIDLTPEQKQETFQKLLGIFRSDNTWDILENRRVRNAFVSLINQLNPTAIHYEAKDYSKPIDLSFIEVLSVLHEKDEGTWKQDPDLQLDLANQVSDAFAFRTADKILRRNFRSLLRFVFSPEYDKPDAVADFYMTLIATANASTKLHKKWDRRLFWNRVLSLASPMPQQLAAYSLNKSIPKRRWVFGQNDYLRFLSPRWLLDTRDHAWFQNWLEKNIQSISELQQFIDEVLRPNHIRVDPLSRDIVEFVTAHKEMIKNKEDLEIIFSDEAFWPHLDDGLLEKNSLETNIVTLLVKLAKEAPAVWKYEPGSSEKMHRYILDRLKDFDALPKTNNERIQLWIRLTDHGVTSETDQLFREAVFNGNIGELDVLLSGLKQSRLWDQDLKYRILKGDMPGMHAKISVLPVGSDERKSQLNETLTNLQKYYPERGFYFQTLLEELSVGIKSTPEESAAIEALKQAQAPSGERQLDLSIRAFSQILESILTWSKPNQWRFFQWLVFDDEPSIRVQKQFKIVGPERIRRMFSILPIAAKAGILDTFLGSPRGLLNKVNIKTGYAQKMIDRLIAFGTPEDQQIARELLDGFLVSLKMTGNAPIQSSVISYLLAFPKDGRSRIGHILKDILEIFGTTGIKIGQFVAAAGVLSREDNDILQGLQENAKIPDRESIYADIRNITNGKNLPVRMTELKGAASLKYVMEAYAGSTQPFVLKILRQEAIGNTAAQFAQLEAMANYMTKKYGRSRYGIFRAIVRAARRAVEKELVLSTEIVKSQAARTAIYSEVHPHPDVTVIVPRNTLLDRNRYQRLVVEQFAEGTSIFKLTPEQQKFMAEIILKIQEENYFSNAPVTVFDPDRHPGNFRIKVYEEGGRTKYILAPIDFGQISEITLEQRSQLIKLFGLAQFLKEVGPTQQILGDIAQIVGANKENLESSFAEHFPSKKMNEVTAYFSVLAALDEAGTSLDNVFFDFVKGIVQLENYERLGVESSSTSPRRKLSEQVKAFADAYRQQLDLTQVEKIKYAAHQIRSATPSGPIDRIKNGLLNTSTRCLHAIAKLVGQ
jgi:hypothetical protein